MAIDDMKREHEEKRGKYMGLVSALTSLKCELTKLCIKGEDITYHGEFINLPDRIMGFNMKNLVTKMNG